MSNELKDVIGIDEVAEKLCVTKGSVYKMVRDGALAEPMRTLSGVIIGWDKEQISDSLNKGLTAKPSMAESIYKDEKVQISLSKASELLHISTTTTMQWLNKVRTGRSFYSSTKGQKMTITDLKAILKSKGAKKAHLGVDGYVPAVVRLGELKCAAGFDDRDIGVMVSKGVLPEPMRMHSSEVYGWTDLCIKECLGIEMFNDESKLSGGGASVLSERLHLLPPVFNRQELKNKQWAGLATGQMVDNALRSLIEKGMLREVRFIDENDKKLQEYVIHPSYRK